MEVASIERLPEGTDAETCESIIAAHVTMKCG